jgi:hypothetical protein
MKLYVDGVLETMAGSVKGFAAANQSTVILGARGSADDEYFTGLIDDLRVFKVALTADEALVLSGAGRNAGAVAAEMTGATTEAWKQLSIRPVGRGHVFCFTRSPCVAVRHRGGGRSRCGGCFGGDDREGRGEEVTFTHPSSWAVACDME